MRWILPAIITLCFAPSLLHALPADIEADRLVLAAEQRLAAGDEAGAQAYLARIPDLKVTPPVRYHFLAGKVLFSRGEDAAAKRALEQFVEQAGRKSPGYEEALGLLTRIESRSAPQTPPSAGAPLSPAGARADDAYDETLKTLYPGMSLPEALATHINGQLADHPQRAAPGQGVTRFHFAPGPSGSLVFTRIDESDQRSLRPETLKTYGLDARVSFRCTPAACIIAHPLTGHDWVLMAPDAGAAADVARALGRLIRSLQKPT